ncbi:hypothetical protein CAPTEDRAFT_37161, partial [Capitella teleta]
MGTFVGHALPGAFFALFSLWWLSQIPRRFVFCSRRNLAFRNTATYPVKGSGCCGKCPIEGVIKMSVTLIGMMAELYAATGYGDNSSGIVWGDIQHLTMYLFFFLSGLIDVLTQRRCLAVPPGSDYALASLAFGAEWLLFSEHLRGRPPLDVHLHSILLYVIAACVMVTLLEYKHPHCLLLGLLRCACVLLQGTWFFQVGFVLYPPTPHLHHWDEDDHENMMLATVIFIWHLGACVVFVVIMF